MTFDFAGIWRFSVLWLASLRSMKWRFAPRRLAILVAFYVFFPVLELFVWSGLFLDDVFFRRYRRRRVEAPVFIVGNFRSGTTFLHRLLAQDQERFTTMEMWEILFAPSIVGRKLGRALMGLDRFVGRLFGRRIERMEEGWHEKNVMHKVSLREPEEDDYLLLHGWSLLTVGLSSGLLELARPYVYFDHEIPEAKRRRILRFYHRLVKRHLHLHPGKTYLAKNPALTPKLDSLFEEFPDARVIYLARTPLEAVPSFVSMMDFTWRVLGDPPEGDALRELLLEMAGHWYRYPPERLAREDEKRFAIVDYEEMTRDPQAVVERVYARFGLDVGPDFARALAAATERARQYRSRHEYSFAELGLDRQRMVEEFADVFERFGFATDATRRTRRD